MKIKKWTLDAATAIALAALFVSLIQLIFTTPMIIERFVGPNLVITGKGSSIDAKVLLGFYTLTNEGNAPATNIQVGLTIEPSQRIDIVPAIQSNVVITSDTVLLKSVRIEIPILTPGESVQILAMPGPGLEVVGLKLKDELVKSSFEIPFINFLRSNEGNGEIIRSSNH